VRGAEYVLDAIAAESVGAVFMVPGGMNDAFMGPMTATPGVRTVVAAHEGGAAYMADGYARASGRFGVAFGIGGPGVFNMTTALGSARSDRSRVLAISGEVPTTLEGRGMFQDASGAGLDDLDVIRPVVGRSLAAEDVATLPSDLRALLTWMLARNEPTHLSLPTDVQAAEVKTPWTPLPAAAYSPTPLDQDALDDAVWPMLTSAQRVVALAGSGVRGDRGADALRRFAERFGVPVATTLEAKGVLGEDHPLSLGVFGYAGSRWATEAVLDPAVEVLLVFGVDLNQRNTLYWDERMRPTTAIVQVDSDPTVIGRPWPAVPVIGEPAAALEALAGAAHSAADAFAATSPIRMAALQTVRASGDRRYDPEHQTSSQVPIHPARAIAELHATAPAGTVLCVDSGAHRAWAGHYWTADTPGRYLTATNLGPMGAALPLAIGAWFARPDLPHAVVIGDGCMLMHGLELHTAARYEVPLVVIVMNNQSYGNIWFRAHVVSEAAAHLTDIPDIDWAAFARSLGAHATTVTDPADLAAAYTAAFDDARRSRRPHLLDVRIDKSAAKPTTPWSDAMHEWEDHH
jgi:acetolactate synthase-1/2/3 large subunit